MAVRQRTANACVPFEGRPIKFQAEAAHRIWVELGEQPSTWAWVSTTCRTDCLNVDHMMMRSPQSLAYPYGVCIYCGRSAGTKDHLLPKNWSGAAKRAYVVTVPACGTCNSLLRDTLTWSITERRMICHHRLRRHFRKVLGTVDFGETDIRKFEGTLRKEVRQSIKAKREVEAMLAWPEHDPGYDQRACERAGIEDPYAIGILAHHDEAARVAREVVGVENEEDRRDTNVAAYGFRSHGQLSTYRLGCRCDLCVKARRAFRARSKKPKKPRVYDE